MAKSFHITYALYKGECILANIFRNVVRSLSEDFRGDELVCRFIGVRTDTDGGALEGCIRVSFKQSELLDGLLGGLMRQSGVKYRIVFKGRGNVVLWFKHDKMCKVCQVVHASGGVTPKTMLVTPLGLIFEFISSGKSKLDESLFSTLISGNAKEMMDYLLTAREQEILYYAYTRGYYSQPRSITLRQLAVELGFSKFTLNEILRSAERKIVTAYMRHDLPHLIMSKILMRKHVDRCNAASVQYKC